MMFHGDLPYSSKDIIKKLETLNEEHIIGIGGFGTVYKLAMDDGNVFALKRIVKLNEGFDRFFERELEILGSIKHRYLVNLRGYCNSPTSKLLIYDYLPGGSLDEALHHECQENRVDELLNGSLRLLDVCTAAKDSLLHTKECMRELQSVMRRRKGGEVELKAEIKKFLTSRKVVKKAISKALANLKGTSKNCNISSANNDNQLISLLENVEVVTLSTFQALLQLISGTTQSKSSSWSLVSKKVSYSQLAYESEFAQLDEALQSCMFAKTSKFESMNKLQNQLEKVESLTQDLEEGLEFLFRRLIKTRVALLNILNH